MSKGDLINLRDGLMLEIKLVRLALERMEERIAAVEAQCGVAAVEGDDASPRTTQADLLVERANRSASAQQAQLARIPSRRVYGRR